MHLVRVISSFLLAAVGLDSASNTAIDLKVVREEPQGRAMPSLPYRLQRILVFTHRLSGLVV